LFLNYKTIKKTIKESLLYMCIGFVDVFIEMIKKSRVPLFVIGTTLYIFTCFHYFKQRNLPCLLFYVDMRILINKALKYFYMLWESLINIKEIYI